MTTYLGKTTTPANADLDTLPQLAGLMPGLPTNVVAALASRGLAVYNVKASPYNAIGNSIADDTAAFNTATAAARDGGGGLVIVPPGGYRLTNPVQVYTDVWLVGAGHGASWIKQDNPAVDIIQLVGSRARLTDFILSYNAPANTGTYAVKIQDASRCRLVNVTTFSNVARALGIIATGAGAEGCVRNYMQRFIVGGGASEYGVVLSGFSAMLAVLDQFFDGCQFSSCSLTGALLLDWVQGTYFGTHSIIDFCTQGMFINPSAPGRTFDVFLDNTVFDATVSGEHLRAKNTSGLYMDDVWWGAVPPGVNGVHLESTVTRAYISGGRASHKEAGVAGASVFFCDGQTSQIKGVTIVQGAVAPSAAAISLGPNAQFCDVFGNTLEGFAVGKDVIDNGANNRVGPNYADGYGPEARFASRVRMPKLNIAGGTDILGHLSVSSPYDPPNIAAGTQSPVDMVVNGAALGDTVVPSFDKDLQGLRLSAGVKAVNTVTVIFRNDTAGAIDLAAGNLRVDVWKH